MYNEALIFTLFELCRLQDQELTPKNCLQLRKALMQYFKQSSFVGENTGIKPNEHVSSSMVHSSPLDSDTLNLFTIPFKKKEENPRAQHESYISALWKLRDQVTLYLSIHAHAHTYMHSNNAPQILYFRIRRVFCCYNYIASFIAEQLVLIINKI